MPTVLKSGYHNLLEPSGSVVNYVAVVCIFLCFVRISAFIFRATARLYSRRALGSNRVRGFVLR